MRATAIVIALVGVFLFSKFYLAGPGASDGQQVVSKFVHDQSHGTMRLAGFRQIGGKEFMLSGVRVYVMNFEASVECTDGDRSSTGTTVQFAFDRRRGTEVEPMHAGDRRTVKGSIQFEKTAYAWVGQPM